MLDLKANMHQIQFWLELRPRPRWGAITALPQTTYSWIKGGLLLREGDGNSWEKGREGKGKEGEGKRGRGRERDGETREGIGPPSYC